MSKTSKALAPSPERDPNVWVAPTSDQEFVFESMNDAPEWVDRGWAGFDQGPALRIPAGDLVGGTGPYHTKVARPGDTVKFIANKGAIAARIEVLQGDQVNPLVIGTSTKLPPQQTNASLEDMIKGGFMAQADFAQASLDQVTTRSPGIKPYLATPDGTGAAIPTPVAVGTYVKGST